MQLELDLKNIQVRELATPWKDLSKSNIFRTLFFFRETGIKTVLSQHVAENKTFILKVQYRDLVVPRSGPIQNVVKVAG